jgi:predicted dehydrogenase
MRGLLVGFGSAGYSWYKWLRDRGLLAAVVEVDPAMKSKLEGDPYSFYTDLDEALEREKPDFLVNVTSPMAHTVVNNKAFDRKLPVLCEKPISFDYKESVNVVRRAHQEGIPFMIAENYRRLPYIRKMKQLLEDGLIGTVSSADIQFYRYHKVERKYTVSLLDDIGVHHFDLLRYLTGAEGGEVWSRLYNPVGGWQDDGAVISAQAFIKMDHGIAASYTATIAARGTETPWCGNWRIEGTEGALELTDKNIRLFRQGQVQCMDDLEGVDQTDTLDEFLASLREGREAETSGRDYIKTQAMVHYAKQAHGSGQLTGIVLPELP